MKWLLIVGLIAIIINVPAALANSKEDSSSSSSSSSSSGEDKKDHSKKPLIPISGNQKPGKGRKTNSKTEHHHSSSLVKILKINTLVLSTEYFGDKSSITIKKVNETYNAVRLDLTVKKNLPVDTKVSIKIYGSTALDGVYKSVGNGWSFGLSETRNKFHRYLPRELVKEIRTKKNLLQGHYVSEDFGFFRFYKLLSLTQLRHKYFKMVYNYEYQGKIIWSLDQRFESLFVHGEGC